MTVVITSYFCCLPSLFIALFDPFFEFLFSESNNLDILNKRPFPVFLDALAADQQKPWTHSVLSAWHHISLEAVCMQSPCSK